METVTSLEGWLTKTKPKKEAAGSCSGIASSRSFQKQVKCLKRIFVCFIQTSISGSKYATLGNVQNTVFHFKPVKPCLVRGTEVGTPCKEREVHRGGQPGGLGTKAGDWGAACQVSGPAARGAGAAALTLGVVTLHDGMIR